MSAPTCLFNTNAFFFPVMDYFINIFLNFYFNSFIFILILIFSVLSIISGILPVLKGNRIKINNRWGIKFCLFFMAGFYLYVSRVFFMWTNYFFKLRNSLYNTRITLCWTYHNQILSIKIRITQFMYSNLNIKYIIPFSWPLVYQVYTVLEFNFHFLLRLVKKALVQGKVQMRSFQNS